MASQIGTKVFIHISFCLQFKLIFEYDVAWMNNFNEAKFIIFIPPPLLYIYETFISIFKFETFLPNAIH